MIFDRFASACSSAAGSSWAFAGSVASVVSWAASGPLFGFSDTWQLVINTSTTVVTFWLVFVIQHTQMRDTKALQAKLDELIHAAPEARDKLIKAEEQPESVINGERVCPHK